MGWIVSIILIILACVKSDLSILVAAGLFAISGSITFGSSRIANTNNKTD